MLKTLLVQDVLPFFLPFSAGLASPVAAFLGATVGFAAAPPFLASACPLPAFAGLDRDTLAERLLQAALPAHSRRGLSALDLPLGGLDATLASRLGGRDPGAHLLARLDLDVAACRTWPIESLRKRLQAAVADDFRRGLTMDVDGWCLSETEGIVYALAQAL